MFKSLAFMITVLFVSSCATTSESIDVSKTSNAEGVVIGKITVTYNGVDFTEYCILSFNERESNTFAVEKDGMIIHKLPKGDSTIRELFCAKYGWDSVRYIFKNPPSFRTYGNGSVTYIGDIEVDWRTANEIKTSGYFGLIGYAITKDDVDGILEYRVNSNLPETKAIFESLKQPKNDPDYKESIVIPKVHKTEKCHVNCP
ncbi:MAG: hypothetical protein ABFS23_01210 [Pseudomonadota bacterium]